MLNDGRDPEELFSFISLKTRNIHQRLHEITARIAYRSARDKMISGGELADAEAEHGSSAEEAGDVEQDDKSVVSSVPSS